MAAEAERGYLRNMFGNGGAMAVSFFISTLAAVCAAFIMVAYSANRSGARGALGIACAISASLVLLLLTYVVSVASAKQDVWQRFVCAVCVSVFIVSASGLAGVLLHTTTQTPFAAAVAFVTASTVWLFLLAANDMWIIDQFYNLKNLTETNPDIIYNGWGNVKPSLFYGTDATRILNYNPMLHHARSARENAAAESLVAHVRRTHNLAC